MKPGKLRPVFYDPNNYKLLAERKNGRFDLVDVNQQTKEVAGSDKAHLLRPVEDTERYIDIDSTSGENFLLFLVNLAPLLRVSLLCLRFKQCIYYKRIINGSSKLIVEQRVFISS